MLKIGSTEVLREEYDTKLGESISRGQIYRAEQTAAEADVATLVGIDMESLNPGQALGIGRRRKGWRDGVILHDWSKVVLA